ncbi:hypothetical protein Naga_100368g9 [Nannochloropsis gaditana]|uniref:Uncharacterized protein n=1 Tax=Nannochloropsis gaditana TaxID=72520 RepID=W7U685_9STRA|nr:hypothetical protein Naga_100368g9 [Nannochloropsis gaditana]
MRQISVVYIRYDVQNVICNGVTGRAREDCSKEEWDEAEKGSVLSMQTGAVRLKRLLNPLQPRFSCSSKLC